MAALADIHEGLAANLSTLPDCQISAWMLGNPTPPTIEVTGAETITTTTMQRGGHTYDMTITGYIAGTTDIGAQKKRALWLAPTGADSVSAAIESDRTLGGVVSDLFVTRIEGNITVRLDNGILLAAVWHVQVET